MKRFTIPRVAHCSDGCSWQSRARLETASTNGEPQSSLGFSVLIDSDRLRVRPGSEPLPDGASIVVGEVEPRNLCRPTEPTIAARVGWSRPVPVGASDTGAFAN